MDWSLLQNDESPEVIEIRAAIDVIERRLEAAREPLNDKVVGHRWFGTVMIREDERGHTYEWTNGDLLNAKNEVAHLESALREAKAALSDRLAIEAAIKEAVETSNAQLLQDTLEAMDVLDPTLRGRAVEMAKGAKKDNRFQYATIANAKAVVEMNNEIIEMAARLGSKIRPESPAR